ncbi:MAG: serine/threonine protein kinase [Phycisphaerae bacterium]|nr:serine/threonine protein kinase [Phycisphaerae bacterium]
MSAPTGVGLGAARPRALPPGEIPGTRIDRYRLLQLIGEGGFGSVYMAEQCEPVQRRVALKIIKAGMDTKQVIARFELERQALAMMDHPNIARVLDAGATKTGRPYFVMELVRGEPVTGYCDQRRLAVSERLELFRDVCHAVQHAHQKGIIHRDLKPTNVLVTVADGRPVPKVIDFGIAKATGARLTDKTLFTEMHQLIGTPEYMSPEQAEVAGIDVDTRSDVYSLGVLLYELLAGSTPLQRERLRSTPLAEIQRLIREEEPLKPSLRFAAIAASSAGTNRSCSRALEIAQQRQSEPANLTRTIRGDLDWIVLKCLEKERSRRYGTANALAEDIGRFLADEPVLAIPPRRSYRLRKFARRHRAGLIGATAVGLSLMLGTIGVAIGFVRAREAERLALTRSEESSRSAAKAAAVNSFLQEMLASVDPAKAQGSEVTIRQALDEAAATVDAGKLRGQPSVEADLRSTIGTTYFAIGHYLEAEHQLRAALALHQGSSNEDAADRVAEDMGNLAGVVGAEGNYAEQESLMRQSLEILRRLHPGDDVNVAGAEQGLAASLRVQGKLNEAERHYRAALEMRRRLYGAENIEIAQSLNSLALLMQNKGNLAEAEALFRDALAMRRRLLGPMHPIVADALNNLANLVHLRGDLTEPESLLREALDIRRTVLGPDHPAVAQNINNIASLMIDQKKFASAEGLYREALGIWQPILPADHLDLAAAKDGLGCALLNQGSLAEAESVLRESLTIRESRQPSTDIQRLTTASMLGEACAREGKFKEAESILMQTYSRIETNRNSIARRETIGRLVGLYEQWDRPAEAAKWRTELERASQDGG